MEQQASALSVSITWRGGTDRCESAIQRSSYLVSLPRKAPFLPFTHWPDGSVVVRLVATSDDRLAGDNFKRLHIGFRGLIEMFENYRVNRNIGEHDLRFCSL